MQDADILIINASELVTCAGPVTGRIGDDLGKLDIVRDGALAIRGDRIVAVGPTDAVLAGWRATETIDAGHRLVSPGFVDAHSHLLFGGDRCCEYEGKVKGRIQGANLETGINATIQATRRADDRTLVEQALSDLDEALLYGTTTLEAKTGYGLSRDHELRLLRLTSGLRHDIDILPTFLGAHVLPDEYRNRRDEYVQLVIDMLPEVLPYTTSCDVACDPACFTAAECLRIGRRARELGMTLRVHADQTGDAGGAAVAAALGAASADHLDQSSEEGLRAMAAAGTVGIFFPGVTFHMLEMVPPLTEDGIGVAEKPYMPQSVRRALQAGVVLAISADFNPGSCPSISMQMMMQMAMRLFRLSYAEVWNMSTLNPAVSLGLAADRGSLEPGKRADVLIWNEVDHRRAVNRFGSNRVDTVMKSGRVVVRGQNLVRNTGTPAKSPSPAA